MRQPSLFIGHGSPMNALADNSFTRALRDLGAELKEPKAILVVSAHWTTNGTWVTHMAEPRTIHDFYGFPQALFDIRYPASGSAAIAELVREAIPQVSVRFDDSEWGLDHGTWSVLRHLYPRANVPTLQLSLDLSKPAAYHLAIGRGLRELRNQGVLLVGSGNVVHNLRKIRWEENAEPFAWALEFDSWVAEKLRARDEGALVESYQDTEAGRLSIPTAEHYLPLLYVLGAARPEDRLRTVFEGIQNGSISMRTVLLGE